MSSARIEPRYQCGDRVRIDKEITTIPPLPGRVGIVKEVVPCYADKTTGYNLVVENDPRSDRVWFFYQHQLKRVPRRRT